MTAQFVKCAQSGAGKLSALAFYGSSKERIRGSPRPEAKGVDE
jgi:hypothetical protein